MAPVKGKRSSIRTRLPKSDTSTKLKPAAPGAGQDLRLASSKRDKRLTKHSTFVSKIEKTSAKSKRRRRKPSKALVTNLESLADALPDAGDRNGSALEVGDARIKHRSLKSRPGATKRKEKLERLERDRFGKNMAQMLPSSIPVPQISKAPSTQTSVTNEVSNGGNQTSVGGNRWGALRQFISQTMEQKPEFREKAPTPNATL
ncbi:MAG: hypothetical protein M4579_003821 [Chaenotheca gracillima]|nr:MAG: hypothetical protein M4579_003821 [Chaenotheca gracillima]